MKKIIVDYNTSLSNNVDAAWEKDILQGELQLLILDCCELFNSLQVYENLTCEQYSANTILFVNYYRIVNDALVFRCVLSLSKLFDTHDNALTLLKTLNRFKQSIHFKNNNEVKLVLEELIDIHSKAKKDFDFKTPRDKYFAHLDKEKRFSSMNVFKAITSLKELKALMKTIIFKLSALYKICYREDAFVDDKTIEIPDIRDLKNFKERAEETINGNLTFQKRLELTDEGVKYKQKD